MSAPEYDDGDDAVENPSDYDLDDADETVTCPACGRSYHELASLCPHCGHWATSADRTRTRRRPLWWIAVAVVALLAFFWLWVLR